MSEKSDSLLKAIKIIKDNYGDGAIINLGNAGEIKKTDVISTGSLLLNQATGINGVPRGRIIEFFGAEGSGKTSLALEVLAQTKGYSAFFDMEHALDIDYMNQLGIDISKVLISQLSCGEDVFDALEVLINSHSLDLIIVDSVAALVTRAELDGQMDDQQIGSQARLMSKGLKKILNILSKTNTCLIFINQIRTNIGVIYGSKETTTGGRALKFYSSMRFDIKKKEVLKYSTGESYGQTIEIKICKNKFAPPFRTALVELKYGKGINKINEIFQLALQQKIIDQNGAWFSYKKKNIAQGREKVLEYMESNLEFTKEIKSQLDLNNEIKK